MNIALDLDGVLADLHSAIVQHTDYSVEDFKTYGQWDDKEHFYTEAERVWTDETWSVEPTESNIGWMSVALNKHHDVDIVTRTVAPDDVVETWLDEYGVEYGSIVRPPDGEYKNSLEYDVYIDDNPYLAGEVDVQYLIDRPWNQTIPAEDDCIVWNYTPSFTPGPRPSERFDVIKPWVIRIPTLADVVRDLRNWDRNQEEQKLLS